MEIMTSNVVLESLFLTLGRFLLLIHCFHYYFEHVFMYLSPWKKTTTGFQFTSLWENELISRFSL